MTAQTKANNKLKFETGDTPTAADFADLIDSYQDADADLTTWAGITPGTGVGTALAVNVGSAGAIVVNGGAGGTPSAIILTNGTGLPVTGIAASTSAALGVGTVELGHATDTTLARIAAGRVSIEGVEIATLTGTQTLTNKTLTAPALGTPASGTLTNCTGLPAAGLVASTSQAVGFGTIELGHASDTTIARAAAGRATIEGAEIVRSSTTQAGGGSVVQNIVTIGQAAYDAIGTKDANTLYIINGA